MCWMVKEYTCPHFPGWKTNIKEDDVKYRFSITIIMSLLHFFAWECFASFFDVVHIDMMDLSKKIDRPLKFNMEPDMMFAKKGICNSSGKFSGRLCIIRISEEKKAEVKRLQGKELKGEGG